MSQDIHALELEFAKNPSLDACIPLCEAYLANKRYMEAMVVCKKGIKSAPGDPRGRTMLARVYVDQGKLPKAETELNAVNTESPGYPPALGLLGRVYKEQGRNAEAIAALQQALGADPSLGDAAALLTELGGAAPAPQAMPQQQPQQPNFPGDPMQGQPVTQVQPLPAQPMPQQPPQQQTMPPRQPPMQPPPQNAQTPAAPPPNLNAVAQAATPPQAGGAAPNMPTDVPGQDPWANATGQTAINGEEGEDHKPLEHVGDFFAQETLGFSNDGSHIETAGPGRLTIVGFVPKSSGSFKTTLIIFVLLFAGVSAFLAWRFVQGENTREINKLFGEMRVAMDADTYVRYQDTLKLGKKILDIDPAHPLTLSAMAYTEAILGSEHDYDGAMQRAKDYLSRAEAVATEPTSYSVAATALLAFEDKRYADGIAAVKKIMDQGGSSVSIELEAFRLMNALNPETKETKKQLARLKQSVTSDPRVYNHLGWFHYFREEYNDADKYFSQALQNSKGNPVALIGQAMTDLDRGVALKERQKEIEKNIKKVFSLKDELSKPVIALAHFARAQLLQWQDKTEEAAKDYEKAFELDGDNAFLYYKRGSGLLTVGKAEEAVKDLKKAASMETNNIRFYKRLAEAQVKAGDSAGAKASLARAAELSPEDTSVQLLKGDQLRANKDYKGAIKAYEQVKDSNPTDYAAAQMGISAAHRQSGNASAALKHMNNFLEKIPGGVTQQQQAELFCELGRAYDASGNKAKALESYRVGIDQYRLYGGCHYFMCKTLGRGREAKQACKRYLEIEPRGEFAADAKRRSR